MDRRKILKSIALTGAFPLLSFNSGLESERNKPGTFEEPSRGLKVVEETDVVVCGGGPAGVAAAIASARSGAKTRLIELHGSLGGIWTVGLLSNLLDVDGKPGIMREIVQRLDSTGAQIKAQNYDSEVMKLILDQMCAEAGVDVRLHTRVVAAYKNHHNKLETIITESQSGREAWKAKAFIDTTGNGDLAAHAGCHFDFGHPDTGKTQPFSMMAILTGLNYDEMYQNMLFRRPGIVGPDHKERLEAEIKRGGISPSYGRPTLFPIRKDLYALMANQEYNLSALDANDITKATIHSRQDVHNIVDALRSNGGIWKDVRIVATSEQIGMREGRRIRGIYSVTKDDLVKGATFADAVCTVKFPVDIHSLDGTGDRGNGSEGLKAKIYQIPLRSLISKDVGGLMMAGRCISGDFFAHASYRVTGNAVAMGEAAGQVSALAAKKNVLPQEVKWENPYSLK